MKPLMRLDKYLSTVTELSRNLAKKAIKGGRVKVDGVVECDCRCKVAAGARLSLDDNELRAAGLRYIMLHKPQDYVCATKDKIHLTVLDLLDEDNSDRLHIAGRLDIDTTGLVLISDDGRWCHRITSPQHQCAKVYWLETADPISAEAVATLEKGVQLKSDAEPTLPAKMQLIDEHTARLTLYEGRYHQVKRMLAAVGNSVDLLHRESIGNIVLDSDLLPGEYRFLTPEEIGSIA